MARIVVVDQPDPISDLELAPFEERGTVVGEEPQNVESPHNATQAPISPTGELDQPEGNLGPAEEERTDHLVALIDRLYEERFVPEIDESDNADQERRISFINECLEVMGEHFRNGGSETGRQVPLVLIVEKIMCSTLRPKLDEDQIAQAIEGYLECHVLLLVIDCNEKKRRHVVKTVR